MPLSKTIKPNDPKPVSNKRSRKTDKVEEAPSLDENANITIRLSDLGIFKRTPLEEELQIHTGRILQIIDKTIDKLKIVLCLPYCLRNNACVLRRHLQPADVILVQNIHLKYTEASHTQLLQISSIDFQKSTSRKEGKRVSIAKSQEPLIDPEMAQVIETLWKSNGLKNTVLARFEELADQQSITLIKFMKHLKQMIEKILPVTSNELRARERHLQKAWKLNSEVKAAVEKVRQQLGKQFQDLGDQLNVEKTILKDWQIRAQQTREEIKDGMQNRTLESVKVMTKDSNTSVRRQTKLELEAKNSIQQYETILHSHLEFEKKLRAKRLKVETQVSSWLTKYDADVGEKQAEYEEIKDGYDAEKAIMEALQEQFDEQEEEYNVLMAEKDVEEQEIFETNAYNFLINRSARKIQKYWKLYKRTKHEQKMAKIAAKKERAAKKAKKAGSGEGGAKKAKKAKK